MQHFKSRLQAQNERIEAKRREIDAANEEVLESIRSYVRRRLFWKNKPKPSRSDGLNRWRLTRSPST